jgi:hypothetical protein
MTTTPLVVRMAPAEDWPAAFRIVCDVSFERAAADMGIPAGGISIGMEDLPPWPQRRRLCLSHAHRCAEVFDDQELAGAWTMLGADPSADTVMKPTPALIERGMSRMIKGAIPPVSASGTPLKTSAASAADPRS